MHITVGFQPVRDQQLTLRGMHNKNWFLLIISIILFSSCSNKYLNSSTTEHHLLEANKTTVHTFYRQVIGQTDEALADQLLTENYIQHNPMVKTGKAGFMETLAFLKQMPIPENPSNPIVRTIAEGDYVALHLSVEIGGVKKVVVDLFRLEGDKLAEHWDAIEDHPHQTLNGYSMTDGTVEIEERIFTEEDRQFVLNYYQSIWINGKLDKLSSYIAKELIQHTPEVDNGLEGLKDYLQTGILSITEVHRVIGEGNFAVVQLEGQLDAKPVVVYDILRLQGGKIKEQWRVKQIIPETMAHQNGMI